MKKIVRSVLSGFCFALFGFVGITAGSLVVPWLLIFTTKKHQQKIISKTVHYMWWIFVLIMRVLRLIDINIKNKQKIKNMHGKIIIANHPSLIDVVILIATIPDSICVVKGALFQNIFIKMIVKHAYLSNSMSPETFIAQASELLDNGYNIIIFPEGTRTIPGRLVHLHRGFAYLYLKSRHDIQPIHIKNNPYILGKGQKWYAVGDKTSVYTIKILPCIKSKKMPLNRQNAIKITKLAEKALF